MKSIVSVLFCFIFSLSVSGQKKFSISGSLNDKITGTVVELATVSILNAKDSSFVSGTMSDKNGVFNIKGLAKNKYVLQVSYVGYKTYYAPVTITGDKALTNLGKIALVSDDILLAEAVVEGKAPEITVKGDTVEYNADSYKTTENAVIEELIKKLPGAEVDKDGKITINGKEIKKFKVDGKDFFSDDPQVASKNLPASIVEKLQVLDQKSEMSRMTGFDDGEEETIINITIKSGMKQGTMGNALVGGGMDIEKDNDTRYQAGAFVNHMQNNDRYTLILGANNNNNMGAADLGANQFGGMRMRRGGGGGTGVTESQNFMFNMNKEFSPKLSLNTDIRYNGMDRNSITRTNETLLSKESFRDDSKTGNNYISDNFNLNMRFDWKPDTSNTFIFRPYIRYNNSESNELSTANRFDYYSNDSITSELNKAFNEGEGYTVGADLDFAHRFSKPGRVISLSARGSYNDSYSEENSESWTNNYKDGVFSNTVYLNQRSENDDIGGNFRAQISYVEPLGKNNFLQMFYRASFNNSKGINSTYDLYPADKSLASPIDTAIINPNQSRSTVRNAMEQRYGISFKSVRAKYNYTVGLNLDPSRSLNKTYQPSIGSIPEQYLPYPFNDRLPNIQGDSLYSEIKQNVVNFSPVVDFVYNFGQRSNLRIDYDGETNQPSASQLRNYTDMSRPTNWVTGNPNLKPGYSNELRIRLQKYVPESQLMYNIDLGGVFSINDIVSVSKNVSYDSVVVNDKLYKDILVRETSYENVNGNWNVIARGMFNIPLRNKKFTVANFLTFSFRNQKSYTDMIENTMKNLSVMERPNINYRSELFDFGLNMNFGYGKIEYSVNPENNQETYNWGAGAYTTWYLPYKFTVESDFNWTDRAGYAEGYNISEMIWNASVAKQLFNKKAGTGSLKLQIYDILKDRNNISASNTTNGFRTTEFNTIPSFFMCSFIYKFTVFPKGSSTTSQDFENPDFRGGRGNWGGGRGERGGGGRF